MQGTNDTFMILVISIVDAFRPGGLALRYDGYLARHV